jgi:hypothetical protein
MPKEGLWILKILISTWNDYSNLPKRTVFIWHCLMVRQTQRTKWNTKMSVNKKLHHTLLLTCLHAGWMWIVGCMVLQAVVQYAPAQLLHVTQRTCRRTHMQLSEGGMLPEREMERGRPPTEGLLCNTRSLLLLLLIGTATVFSFSPPTWIIDTCCLSTEYMWVRSSMGRSDCNRAYKHPKLYFLFASKMSCPSSHPPPL